MVLYRSLLGILAVVLASTLTIAPQGPGEGESRVLAGKECAISAPAREYAPLVATPRNARIWRAYQATFGRQPDRAGFDHWVASGLSVFDLGEMFLALPEAAGRVDSLSDEQFVASLYDRVLCRPVDRAGLVHWASLLGQGLSRGQLLALFSEGREFMRLTRTCESSIADENVYCWQADGVGLPIPSVTRTLRPVPSVPSATTAPTIESPSVPLTTVKGTTSVTAPPSSAQATIAAQATTTTGSTTTGSTTTKLTATAAPTTTTRPTTVKPTTTANPATTTSAHGEHKAKSNDHLQAIRNTNPLFAQFEDVPSNLLKISDLTFATDTPHNGPGDGNFRAACQYSHFSYDDPIVYPGQPGKSHLHMFFGNTRTDAHTTTDSLVNSGGGSCSGFELNRSAYWTPALLDGRGNAVVPDNIILYYKTKKEEQIQRMPHGLELIAGNTHGSSFEVSDDLFWSCGASGIIKSKSGSIPNCGSDPIAANIKFPQCWDGRNLSSTDNLSHVFMATVYEDCPASHPVRLPQISILLYFPPQSSVDGWRLSSDVPNTPTPGGALHADWIGGWHNDVMDMWTFSCVQSGHNCSGGQLGNGLILDKISRLQDYEGPNFLPVGGK